MGSEHRIHSNPTSIEPRGHTDGDAVIRRDGCHCGNRHGHFRNHHPLCPPDFGKNAFFPSVRRSSRISTRAPCSRRCESLATQRQEKESREIHRNPPPLASIPNNPLEKDPPAHGHGVEKKDFPQTGEDGHPQDPYDPSRAGAASARAPRPARTQRIRRRFVPLFLPGSV